MKPSFATGDMKLKWTRSHAKELFACIAMCIVLSECDHKLNSVTVRPDPAEIHGDWIIQTLPKVVIQNLGSHSVKKSHFILMPKFSAKVNDVPCTEFANGVGNNWRILTGDGQWEIARIGHASGPDTFVINVLIANAPPLQFDICLSLDGDLVLAAFPDPDVSTPIVYKKARHQENEKP